MTAAMRTEALPERATVRGLIDAAVAQRITREARERRCGVVELLAPELRGGVSALRDLATDAGLPFVDVSAVEPERALLERVAEQLLRRKHVLPIRREGAVVLVASAAPEDVQTLDALERALGAPLRLALADPHALDTAIERALARLRNRTANLTARVANAAEDVAAAQGPVGLLDELLSEAFGQRASDVHLEPLPNELRVRYRIDGHLHVRRPSVRSDAAAPLLSRLKVLAGMDIAERREPQDGGFSWSPSPDARPVDLRVATAPTRHGERATIRLLGVETDALRLATLGLDPQRLEALRAVVNRPHGMILLCGPTGSGKTTTLYAAMREINEPDVNIITVEDPIEYSIPGVNQVQVDDVGKMTFANALRALLRHDPDVLMVGEIRDGETADVAIKAALTGHLVLSTLHTNSACGAISRLVDLGAQSFLVASTVAALIAQRLVRRLCSLCRRARTPSPDEVALVGDLPAIFEPVGCPACFGTGYRGRIGIFEIVIVDGELRRLVTRGATDRELEAEAARRGVRTLREDGLARVREGITTVDEVLSATVEV